MKKNINDLFVDGKNFEKIEKKYQIDPKRFEKFLVKKFGICEIEMNFYSVNDKRFLDFKYEVDVTYSCARCLDQVDRRLKESFSLEILEEGNKFGEDVGVLIVEDGIVDIEDILLESLYINLETSILCSEDCKGLCPKCGANLNKAKCGCDLHEIDPRFSKLIDLKEKLDK